MSPLSLAEQHMSYARRIAWHWSQRSGFDFDDVYGDALVGLVKAERAYDPSRGRFETFAFGLIRGEILHGIRRWTKYRKENKHEQPRFVHVDNPAITWEPREPRDDYAASDLWRTVETLPEKERVAVRLYYQWDLSQQEAAGLMGISQMHVSRLLRQAAAKLVEAI